MSIWLDYKSWWWILPIYVSQRAVERAVSSQQSAEISNSDTIHHSVGTGGPNVISLVGRGFLQDPLMWKINRNVPIFGNVCTNDIMWSSCQIKKILLSEVYLRRGICAGFGRLKKQRGEKEWGREREIISLTNSFCGQRSFVRSFGSDPPQQSYRSMDVCARDVFLMSASGTKTSFLVFPPCHFPRELRKAHWNEIRNGGMACWLATLKRLRGAT